MSAESKRRKIIIALLSLAVILLIIYLFLQRQHIIVSSSSSTPTSTPTPTPTSTPTPTPTSTPTPTPTSTPTPTPTSTPTPTPTPSYLNNYAQYLCSQGYFGNGICVWQQQIAITETTWQPGNGYWVFQNTANVPICVGASQAASPVTYCFPNCSSSCTSPSCVGGYGQFPPGGCGQFYPVGCLPPNSSGYLPDVGNAPFTEFYLIYAGAIYAGYDAQAYKNYVIPLIPVPSSFQQGYIINNTGQSISIQVTNYQAFPNNITNSWTINIVNNVTLPIWYNNNTTITASYLGNPGTYQEFQMPSNGQLVITNIS